MAPYVAHFVSGTPRVICGDKSVLVRDLGRLIIAADDVPAMQPGTPAYMAPEQSIGSISNVDCDTINLGQYLPRAIIMKFLRIFGGLAGMPIGETNGGAADCVPADSILPRHRRESVGPSRANGKFAPAGRHDNLVFILFR